MKPLTKILFTCIMSWIILGIANYYGNIDSLLWIFITVVCALVAVFTTILVIWLWVTGDYEDE